MIIKKNRQRHKAITELEPYGTKPVRISAYLSRTEIELFRLYCIEHKISMSDAIRSVIRRSIIGDVRNVYKG